MKNIYGKTMELLPFQKEILKKILGQNAIVSAPTGSGKTPIAYTWAFGEENDRIIFTAPIKALSNERFRELVENFGADKVGINTGDVKKNLGAPIIACTQEIYTSVYAQNPNQAVVIDEIHYIFDNQDRSRAYIDGIRNTHPSSKLLLLSATIGSPENFVEYLENMSGRSFVLATSQHRPVPQKFIGEITPRTAIDENLTPAIIFLFSQKAITQTAYELMDLSSMFPEKKETRKEVNDLADKYKVSQYCRSLALNKVAIYHGGLLYKEKVFFEEVTRRKLVNFIVGTDALSLGVNLPAKTVIFGQLAKYYEGQISKREFLQMSGRAGRFGLYDKGYVGYYESEWESYNYYTGDIYRYLTDENTPIEAGSLVLKADLRAILNGTKTPEDEAEYVARFSVDLENKETIVSKEYVLQEIKYDLQDIQYFIDEHIGKEDAENVFREILADVWFPEFPIDKNLSFAYNLFSKGYLNAKEIVVLKNEEITGRDMYYLLQVRKYLKAVKSLRYKVVGLRELENYIKTVDHLVLG